MKYIKNISAGTIARTIFLALALINQVLAVFGKPILNRRSDRSGGFYFLDDRGYNNRVVEQQQLYNRRDHGGSIQGGC